MPHSEQAEHATLACLMLDPTCTAWEQVADILKEDDFYFEDNRTAFAAIADLAGKQKPTDLVSVAEHLDSKVSLNGTEWLSYLGGIGELGVSIGSARNYAEKVRETARHRQLLKVLGDMQARVLESDDAVSLAAELENDFKRTAETMGGDSGFISPSDAVLHAVNAIEERFASGGALVGLESGWPDLDQLTNGILRPAELVIIGGRPSMGKTAFALNLADHVSINGNTVAFFSLEMTAEQLTMRRIASLGRVDSSAIQTGKIKDEDWPRITSSVNIIKQAPLFIYDRSGMSAAEIRSACKRLKAEQGALALVVIDYLGFMKLPKADRHDLAIAQVTADLKRLARELNLPVLLLVQLNRNVSNRADKRPTLADIRDSGAIEQDADVVLMLHREAYYDPTTENKAHADVLIRKHRNGEQGTVPLVFEGQFACFSSFSYVQETRL